MLLFRFQIALVVLQDYITSSSADHVAVLNDLLSGLAQFGQLCDPPSDADMEELRMLMTEHIDRKREAWYVDGREILERCWCSMGRMDRREVGLCRAGFVFLYATNPTDFHSEQCSKWAWILLPDFTFLYDLRTMRDEVNAYVWDVMSHLRFPKNWKYWHVGGNAFMSPVEKLLVRFRPSWMHVFEPVPEYCVSYRAVAVKLYQNVTVHCYGISSETSFSQPFAVHGGDGQSSSMYQHVRFSERRMFLARDAEDRRTRNTPVVMRSAVETWNDLVGASQLHVLSINCEGCEFVIIPALAAADLLGRISVVLVWSHLILQHDEVADEIRDGRCDRGSGTCHVNASLSGIAQYCKMQQVLESTHVRVAGLPHEYHYQVWLHRSFNRSDYIDGNRWDRTPLQLYRSSSDNRDGLAKE